ncbi:MAG: bifunctional pyr operon transcriptional regulator/uracil phosphoribosyltransferase PyrR [Magnetococcales bacterium]|nr:bifunctional pyr operon transcriptional regulator/uracil phosphoribosyltransferase PyrR [Magnetococcales bacterium]
MMITERDTVLLSNSAVLTAIDQLADRIYRDFTQPQKRVVVGIRRGGALVAHLLWQRLNQQLDFELPIGFLDISFYRDDHNTVASNPIIGATDLTMNIDDKRIILVDDVLFTGRTIRAALNALFDYGRPEIVDLLVLADRGGRQLPIKPNYCGLDIDASHQESIKLIDQGTEGLILVRRPLDNLG